MRGNLTEARLGDIRRIVAREINSCDRLIKIKYALSTKDPRKRWRR